MYIFHVQPPSSFSFFGQEKPLIHVHYCSFEIHDFDIQLLQGHQWLEKRGWKLCWGVGRHMFGSQIFDYSYDVHGLMIEFYANDDLNVVCLRP